MSDPFFGTVSSLLHFDGPDGSTTFTDETGKVWTAQGNAQISTAQSKFGGTSLYLDGSTGYLSIPHNAAFNIGSGDFTFEGWIYTTSSAAQNIVLFNSDADHPSYSQLRIDIFSDEVFPGGVGVLIETTAAEWTFFGGGTVNLNEWTYIAVVRASGTITIYINGVAVANKIIGAPVLTSGVTQIGSLYPYDNYLGTQWFSGYLDEFRFTVGVARYTENFTPPAAPFPNTGPPPKPWKSLGNLIRNPIPATFAGNHRINGTVRLESVPADSRLIALLDRKNMRLIATTRSAADGSYEFSSIRAGTYLVAGVDRKTNYHPDIVRVDSEPMP